MRAGEYNQDLQQFNAQYHYQPELTHYLDTLEGDYNQDIINQIILWKINRCAQIGNDLLESLNRAIILTIGQHRNCNSLLNNLLSIHGIDLPMASTLLRFRNPNVFQIIDRHAYRAVYDSSYPLYTNSKTEIKIQLYFKYLDDLSNLCQSRGLDFASIDRLLYVFDKQINGPLQ